MRTIGLCKLHALVNRQNQCPEALAGSPPFGLVSLGSLSAPLQPLPHG
jgi:hypothetical protein